jgi:hypothetical protein
MNAIAILASLLATSPQALNIIVATASAIQTQNPGTSAATNAAATVSVINALLAQESSAQNVLTAAGPVLVTFITALHTAIAGIHAATAAAPAVGVAKAA